MKKWVRLVTKHARICVDPTEFVEIGVTKQQPTAVFAIPKNYNGNQDAIAQWVFESEHDATAAAMLLTEQNK